MRSIVICEKPSQAKTVRAAIGSRHGQVLAAAGHLLRLRTPDETRPEWKTWTSELLWPGQFYAKAVDPGRRGFFDPIKQALAGADRAIIATDPDREGLLLGAEIVEFCQFRGEVLRANLLAMDPESVRKAFASLVPFSEVRALYDSGRAREQADQIVNLSLTRAATVNLRAEGTRLELAHGDGRFPRLFRSLVKADLLILDDWGPERLTPRQRRDLMEIVEDRHGQGSILITSQLPVAAWHDVIDEPTFADAILDRLVHNAYRLELDGPLNAPVE